MAENEEISKAVGFDLEAYREAMAYYDMDLGGDVFELFDQLLKYCMTFGFPGTVEACYFDNEDDNFLPADKEDPDWLSKTEVLVDRCLQVMCEYANSPEYRFYYRDALRELRGEMRRGE